MAKKDEIRLLRHQANFSIEQIAELQKQRKGVNEFVAQKRAYYEKKAQGILDNIEKKLESQMHHLFTLFNKNKALFTKNGKIKVVKLPSGEMAIFLTKGKIKIRNEKQVVPTLPERFIIRSVKANREAIRRHLKAVAHIKEISLVQTEKFSVRPKATKEAEIESTKKLAKPLK